MTRTPFVLAGILLGALIASLALPRAHADTPSGCQDWEVQIYSPQKPDPSPYDPKRMHWDSGPAAIPTGWEPFAYSPAANYALRRCKSF